MELLNAMKAADSNSASLREALCIMLAPFAPHLAEEIWQEGLKKKGSVFAARWPQFDPALTVLDEIEVAVQINGKVRDRVIVAREASKEELEAAALATEAVTKLTSAGSAVKKVIVVPGRLVNVIVG
jgi:leucyl-tRNA synthetase